ncbi:sulfite exporter TauE/SafE family protein [Streptomyces sp. H27-S2]|uniref:sulfite exporter TauE/SafE family protein n=1 Tax=Streptomyces antarcticus TaxID=2996458 RepID=UPI002271E0CC|nr:sulfite exporter TauE/SafE family protein [Streptomyces sp. H27-S2]MCY0955151.1 sulfite exporter TauE/SafE family protein [Streptomyces sp. H27-S2]
MPSSLALLATGLSTGLFAGGASCAAVQGGLLAGAVTRRSPAAPAPVPAMAGPRRASQRRKSNPAPAPGSAPEPKALVPVGAFLAGKLLSHSLLGALLGVFGDVLQPSPRARAVMLIASAALMLLFALDLFGVKAVARLVPRPPASFGRVLRRSAKTDSVATPALIGLATVLVPCGVTLSVELIAVTSGSPVAGAAVMAGFVVGTAPLFTALGYLFRRTSRALSRRLAVVTGVVVLAVAVWTAASGLQAGGWASFSTNGTPPAAAAPVPNGSGGATEEQEPAADALVRIDAAGKQIVTLTVTDFYEPTSFTAKAGVPTTLVLRGKDSGGCARAFTIPELGVQEIVKRDGDTEIDLGTRKPGTLRFSCAMGMQTGSIDFKEGA